MADTEVGPLMIPGTVRSTAAPDFTIYVEGEELKVNKDVLKTKSEYFRCMFDSGMQEVQKASVELKEMNKQVVRTIIAYAYGEAVTIKWEDVMKYVDVIEQWQVTDLKDHVERYISSNVNIFNFTDLTSIAAQYNMEKVQDDVKTFLSANFDRVLSRTLFLSLDLEDLKRLVPKDIVLNISCDKKLKACLRWLQYKEQLRVACIDDLMDHFELAVHEDFMKLLGNCCRGDVMKFKQHKSLQLSDVSKSKVGEKNDGFTMVALGSEDLVDQRVKKLLKYDFKAETVDTVGTVPKLFEELLSSCHTPFGLFAIGGKFKSYTCAILDVHTLNFLQLPDFPIAMSGIRAVYRRGKVYVLGQCQQANLLYSLNIDAQRFCRWIELDCEFRCDPILSCTSQLCAVANKLYLLCNARDLICLSQQTNGNKWLIEKVASPENLLTHPWYTNITAVDRQLYILGNTNQSNVRYSRWMNSFDIAPSLQQRSGQCSYVYLSGLNAIVLSGGFRPEIELYDLDSDQWRISKLQMPYKTSVVTMAV